MTSTIRRLIAVASVTLLATACGSRHTVEELRAAHLGSEASGAGDGAGAGAGPAGEAAIASLPGQDQTGLPDTDPSGAAPVAAGSGAAATRSVGAAAGPVASSGATATPKGGATTAAPAMGGKGAGPAATGAQGSAAPVPGTSNQGSKEEIVIGSVGNYSGIPGASLAPGATAVRAWAQWVNGMGGINGHPVRLIVGDDGSDPARHQQIVQQFVEQRGVKAFVYNGETLTGQSSVRYLNEKRVPLIGSEGSEQYFNESAMHFSVFSQGHVLMKSWLTGAAQLMVPQKKTKFGFIACQEAQFCNDAVTVWPSLARSVGLDLAYQSRVSLAQPSFTAECLGARNAGVDFFYIVSDANSWGRVGRDCKAVGYSPTYGVPSAIVLDRIKDDPTIAGSTITTPPIVPWFFDENPEIRQFQTIMSRFAPGTTADGPASLGWTSARLFEAAARLTADPATSPGILEGLWSLKGETVGGLTYPISYVRDAPNPSKACWSHVSIDKGSFSSPTNGKFSCAS
jgi:branched-chain amino acid transport system substrate-binding protein